MTRRPEAGIALALAGLCALLWSPLWSGERTLYVQDVAAYFYPMKDWLAHAVRAGEWPWWNPWIRNGLPFYANPQVGLFYPPTVLFYLLPSTALALNWVTILHFVVAATGFFLWLARDGRSSGAAAFGAMAIAFGGTAVSLANYLNNLQAFAWVGWTLWAWRGWIGSAAPRWLAVAAIGFGLQFLGGEPALAVVTAVLALGSAWADPEAVRLRGYGRPALALGAAALAAMAVTAVQLGPTAELLMNSGRRAGLPAEEALAWSLAPAEALNLLVPRYFVGPEGGFDFRHVRSAGHPWLYTAYLGVLAPALAAAAFARERRSWSLFWAGVSLAGILLALGEHNPLYARAVELPGGAFVRYPERFLVLPAIGVPVLGAAGLDALAGGRAVAGRILAAAGLVTLVAVAAVPLRSMAAPPTPASARPDADPVRARDARAARHVALAALGLTALVLARRRLPPRALAGAVVVLATVDLATVNLQAAPKAPAAIYRIEPAVLRGLPRADLATRSRVRTSPLGGDVARHFQRSGASPIDQQRFLMRAMGPNLSMVHRVLAEDGAEAFRPIHDDWRTEILGQLPLPLQVRYLRLAGTALVHERPGVLDGVPGLEPLPGEPVPGLRAYRVTDPLPRAYLVTRAIVETDSIAAINRLLAGGEDPHVVAYVDRGPGVDGPAERVAGGVRWLPGNNHTVRLEVTAPGPSLLVLTDTAYPGWRATVDGRAAPLLRANWHFRAVRVEGGDHVVEFGYRPRWIALYAGISLLALAALVGIVARGGRVRGA